MAVKGQLQKGNKKNVSKIKVKKKTWFKIISPKIFGNKEIGESYLADAGKAVGRKMKIGLRELTGNVKDQNVYVGLQVSSVNGSLLNTSVVSYELTSSYVKRMIRKNIGRLDDCFKLKTKGGKNVILKSLLITLYKAKRSTNTQLRKELMNLFKEEVGQASFDNFVVNLVNYKIQNIFKKKLSKIFPVKELGVRVFELKEKDSVQEEIIVKDKTKETAREVAKEDTKVNEEESSEAADKNQDDNESNHEIKVSNDKKETIDEETTP